MDTASKDNPQERTYTRRNEGTRTVQEGDANQRKRKPTKKSNNDVKKLNSHITVLTNRESSFVPSKDHLQERTDTRQYEGIRTVQEGDANQLPSVRNGSLECNFQQPKNYYGVPQLPETSHSEDKYEHIRSKYMYQNEVMRTAQAEHQNEELRQPNTPQLLNMITAVLLITCFLIALNHIYEISTTVVPDKEANAIFTAEKKPNGIDTEQKEILVPTENSCVGHKDCESKDELKEDLQHCQTLLRKLSDDLQKVNSKANANEMLKELEVQKHGNLLDKIMLLESDNYQLSVQRYIFLIIIVSFILVKCINHVLS